MATIWRPEPGERLFRVIRHDGTEVIVSAPNHTKAKVKAATWFVYAAKKRWPDVISCRLVKGVY